MSYDVSIGEHSFNYTWNMSKLFYDHIPADRDRGGLHELNGLTGKQAAEVLSDAFARIDQTRHGVWTHERIGDPEFCAMYDAPNGWGSTIGAVLFLAEILAACALNPRKKIRIS